MAYRIQILLLALSFFATGAVRSSGQEWRDYGKDASRTYFSPLDQIRKENVRNLRVAWVYHAGDSSDALKSSMECNPLIVNGVMYVTSPVMRVIALDAGTGREIWSYNPFPERPSYARAWAVATLFMAFLLAVALVIVRMAARRGARPIAAPGLQFYALALILL